MKVERFFEGEPVEFKPSFPPEPQTPQDIFDRVVRHYRAQPRRCAGSGGMCAYRRGNDRCFVGALIDDAHYSPRMEGVQAQDLVVKRFAMPRWFKDNIQLIHDLQMLHDRADWSLMDMALELFAEERGLLMPA